MPDEIIIEHEGHTLACLLRQCIDEIVDDPMGSHACVVTDPMLEGSESLRITGVTRTDLLKALDAATTRLNLVGRSLL